MAENKNLKVIDENYVEERFKHQIKYYWDKSKSNKNMHKQFRFWIITLGALVTLISSLSAADFIRSSEGLRILFAILTPVIAATLTLLNGLSQNFHWGATWRDMVVSATRLQKELDRILATRQGKRNFEKELEILNTLVLEETKYFFQRVLDSEVKPSDKLP